MSLRCLTILMFFGWILEAQNLENGAGAYTRAQFPCFRDFAIETDFGSETSSK
jgi:hypothetical protein